MTTMPRKKEPAVPSGKVCTLCRKDIMVGKKCNLHHIKYEYDKNNEPIADASRGVVVPLCYICHCIVHLRLQFANPYHRRFGKDFGAYFMGRDVMRLFNEHPDVVEEIKRKFPEEFK
jgi:hypothetical protein